jgi:L-fuconolactonase
MAVQSANHDWLESVQEEALEPNLPICDPHHHLWGFRTGATQPRYLLYEMMADLAPLALDGGHNIRSTVFIERAARFHNTAAQVYRL